MNNKDEKFINDIKAWLEQPPDVAFGEIIQNEVVISEPVAGPSGVQNNASTVLLTSRNEKLEKPDVSTIELEPAGSSGIQNVPASRKKVGRPRNDINDSKTPQSKASQKWRDRKRAADSALDDDILKGAEVNRKLQKRLKVLKNHLKIYQKILNLPKAPMNEVSVSLHTPVVNFVEERLEAPIEQLENINLRTEEMQEIIDAEFDVWNIDDLEFNSIE